ncbi:11486_t:CDS:2 [Acaulospora colombiana]|uniref:11486_t:CDS:1 n=1 Tax=Acaulospora colombiana TaxID=27376 RepID=A0ACA9M065_9GLOM|nr:11486_t:CDS:2 [Acaulospora colombiana]
MILPYILVHEERVLNELVVLVLGDFVHLLLPSKAIPAPEDFTYLSASNPEEPQPLPSLGDPASVQLSVIVPAYDETARLKPMIDSTLEHLRSLKPRRSFEIIIVDDGSKDDTSGLALKLSKSHAKTGTKDEIRVVRLKTNRGKGGAVKHGFMHARGERILFVDADNATRFSDLEVLWSKMNEMEKEGEPVIAIGSRAHLVNSEAVVKLFNRAAAQQVFPPLHLPTWIFDVELLVIAQYLSIPVMELPVHWQEIPGSKLNIAGASLEMLRDLGVMTKDNQGSQRYTSLYNPLLFSPSEPPAASFPGLWAKTTVDGPCFHATQPFLHTFISSAQQRSLPRRVRCMAQYTPSAIKPIAGALPDDVEGGRRLEVMEVHDSRQIRDCKRHASRKRFLADMVEAEKQTKDHLSRNPQLPTALSDTFILIPPFFISFTVLPVRLRVCHGHEPVVRTIMLKDSDVTWLYGPLHQAPAVPPTKTASAAEKLGIDMPKPKSNVKQDISPSRSSQATPASKPILKKRSITDILAMAIIPPRAPQHSSSPIYEAVSEQIEESADAKEELVLESEPSTLPPAAGVLQAPSRPPLWHTKSDSILARQPMSSTLSTSPASIHGLSPPRDNSTDLLSKSTSLSPPERSDHHPQRRGQRSDSSSSYQVSDDSTNNGATTKPRRHISFNSFVEQRIVVDPVSTRLSTVYARSSSESGSDDEDDEETVLQMRSSSGSSLSSSRRGSSNSRASFSDPNTPPTARATQMTMITAPIAPTLLKGNDELPAPSPAVVFVAPSGVDEEALRYEVHFASRPHFAVPADRRRAGSQEDWVEESGNWYDQGEVVDYFSGVPLNGEVEVVPHEQPPRESIYTEEDEDAITVRTRKVGGIRSPRGSGFSRQEGSSSKWVDGEDVTTSPTSPQSPSSSQPVPRKSAFSKKYRDSVMNTSVSPPFVSHREVVASRDDDHSLSPTKSRPLGVPRRVVSNSDAPPGSGWSKDEGVVIGSGPPSSLLSASISSARSSSTSTGANSNNATGGLVTAAGARSGSNRNRPRGASFEGVDMVGHTSALSGRSGSSRYGSASGNGGGLVRSHSAAQVSGSRDFDMEEVGRGRSPRVVSDEDRPRRGRSLLRTASSSSISERERSSTTSSSSPIGSLSPHSSSSVGIVGGYIPSSGGSVIIAPSGSVRNGSSLRYEADSSLWSLDARTGRNAAVVQEEEKVDGGDLAQIVNTTPKATSTPGLVRTSSSSNIPAQTSLQNSTQQPRLSTGLKRSSSSTNIVGGSSSNSKPSGLQRTGSSSNIAGQLSSPVPLQRSSSSSNIAASNKTTPVQQQQPHLELVTSPTKNAVPSLVVQPPSAKPSSKQSSASDLRDKQNNDSFASLSGSESTGSFWRNGELESPATPPSPADKAHRSPAIDESGTTSLHRDLLLAKTSLKPRTSGTSLASSTSNGSNSSSATVVPQPASASQSASKSRSSNLASASSSLSSNASASPSTPSSHRRVSSKSSVTTGPTTPPPTIRTGNVPSIATSHVTPAVATRSELGSPGASASEKHLRRLSAGVTSPVEDKSPTMNSASPVSPGSVISTALGNAKGFFDALWKHNDHPA